LFSQESTIIKFKDGVNLQDEHRLWWTCNFCRL